MFNDLKILMEIYFEMKKYIYKFCENPEWGEKLFMIIIIMGLISYGHKLIILSISMKLKLWNFKLKKFFPLAIFHHIDLEEFYAAGHHHNATATKSLLRKNLIYSFRESNMSENFLI